MDTRLLRPAPELGGMGGSSLNSGLVHSWRCDSADATMPDDIGSLDLAMTGTVTVEAVGPSSANALRFNAATEYYGADNAPRAVDYSQPWTVSVWVRFATFSSSGNFFIGQRNGGGDDYFHMRALASENRFTRYNLNSTGNNAADDPTPGLSVWYCYVGRFDGTDQDIFRNGTQTGTVSNTLSTYETGNQNFRLGQSPFGETASTRHNGWLGPCAMWNRALSDDEITELYNGGEFLYLPASGGSPGVRSIYTTAFSDPYQ